MNEKKKKETDSSLTQCCLLLLIRDYTRFKINSFFTDIWCCMHAAGNAPPEFRYLFAPKCQQVRVLCDDRLGQTGFTEVSQLSISFIRSHNTVHASRPCSLVQEHTKTSLSSPLHDNFCKRILVFSAHANSFRPLRFFWSVYA